MRIVTLLLLAALLGACGYKGPLHLPKPKTESQPVKSQQDQKAETQEPSRK